ncbi:hypothetical protein [Mucilaginibacter sp.]|jgi:hypothetical protein|uniref:hypothetical protein n=1 Tax=Mucilaginibacter sp. TaxID=1882438 RepID=UPI002C0EC655|nr:hypothetical protein [Mucilaginibacter sp.]HTI59295.1 hypothetical protein [Mucilaginibacter sp.]
MKVFLSWSKLRSQKVAELLNSWIPCILQSVEPWISSQNIEDGELWFNAIQTQVSEIINGIICLTKENKDQPWILFEAGGLAKGLEKSRIYVLLIDLVPDDILLSPLSAFNQTKPNKTGLKKLMHVINNRTSKPVSTEILDQVFEKFWPDFEEKLKEIITETEIAASTTKKPVKEEVSADILAELLKSIRNLETNVNSIRNANMHVETIKTERAISSPISSLRIKRHINKFLNATTTEKEHLNENKAQLYDYIKARNPDSVLLRSRFERVLEDYVKERDDL